ncbi:MAG: hypothetical protein ACYSW8_29275 [Planctomycetota bacterium]
MNNYTLVVIDSRRSVVAIYRILAPKRGNALQLADDIMASDHPEFHEAGDPSWYLEDRLFSTHVNGSLIVKEGKDL